MIFTSAMLGYSNLLGFSRETLGRGLFVTLSSAPKRFSRTIELLIQLFLSLVRKLVNTGHFHGSTVQAALSFAW